MQPIETAVMGKIVAGLTHEMRNVLAIVQESSGLIEDLLDAGSARGETLEDRLRRALAGIHRQVCRGIDLSDGLNQFAHTLDGPETALPPNEIARMVILLMRRAAQSKQVELVLRENPAAVSQGPVPSRFLLAVCACIGQLIEDGSDPGSLEIRPEAAPGGVALRVSWSEDSPDRRPPADGPAAPPGWDGIFSEISVTLTPLPGGGVTGVLISVGRCDG